MIHCYAERYAKSKTYCFGSYCLAGLVAHKGHSIAHFFGVKKAEREFGIIDDRRQVAADDVYSYHSHGRAVEGGKRDLSRTGYDAQQNTVRHRRQIR